MTFGAILVTTTSDTVFRSTHGKTIGRILVSGPIGLLRFCSSIRTPLPSSSSSWRSSASFKMPAIVQASRPAVYSTFGQYIVVTAGSASVQFADRSLYLVISNRFWKVLVFTSVHERRERFSRNRGGVRLLRPGCLVSPRLYSELCGVCGRCPAMCQRLPESPLVDFRPYAGSIIVR